MRHQYRYHHVLTGDYLFPLLVCSSSSIECLVIEASSSSPGSPRSMTVMLHMAENQSTAIISFPATVGTLDLPHEALIQI